MCSLLTASDKIVTKNAQEAKNHCALQIANDDSSNPASNTITEVGIKILDTNKSANATLTINALPENIFQFSMFFDRGKEKKINNFYEIDKSNKSYVQTVGRCWKTKKKKQQNKIFDDGRLQTACVLLTLFH